MKKIFLISTIVCIILTACDGQKNASTEFPSNSLEPSFTAISITNSTPTNTQPAEPPPKTFTPSPGFTATSQRLSLLEKITQTEPPPTSSPTLTFTPFPPYHAKQVIFVYYVLGQHADYDAFFDHSSCCSITRLVLYDDGQMILAGAGETYKQIVLSSDEIKKFLSQLKTLGFYSLELNQKHDLTDKLYDYGNNYQKSFDGLKYCILVNADGSRNLCVYEPDLKYLIPKMKTILKYIDEYEPAGMTLYYPDRILLSVQADFEPSENNPLATATPWDKDFPPLGTLPRLPYLDTPNPIVYVAGEMAKEIYMFFKGTDGSRVFTQNGKEYWIVIRALLPHEKVMNPYQ